MDGLDIEQTALYLKAAWPAIREQLLTGAYRPSPMRRVTIPKPDGDQRELCIPTGKGLNNVLTIAWFDRLGLPRLS